MNAEVLKSLLDRAVTFHPILARLTGSVSSGIMLSQAIYWSSRTRDPDGWFWKSQKEWFDETALGRREQETARGRLRKTPFWKEREKRYEHKLFFRVIFEPLLEALETHLREAEETHLVPDGGIRHPRMAECASGEGGKRHSKNIDYAETTSLIPPPACLRPAPQGAKPPRSSKNRPTLGSPQLLQEAGG